MNKPLSNLRAELARSGISQVDLSKQLGLNYSSVNNKLNGVTKFTIEEAFQICDILKNPNVRFLFTEDEPKTA